VLALVLMHFGRLEYVGLVLNVRWMDSLLKAVFGKKQIHRFINLGKYQSHHSLEKGNVGMDSVRPIPREGIDSLEDVCYVV